MNLDERKAQVVLGEDSRRQFKRDITNADSLAAEMAAFSNAEGGVIYLGVADGGGLPGLSRADVSRLNQLIANAASQHIRSPIAVQTENLELENGRLVIALAIPKGIDKPYFDRNGVIWLKSGADKRRINSKEELRRLFQAEWVNGENGSPKSSPISSPKTEEQIIALMSQNPMISTEQIAEILGITKRAVLKQIQKLKTQGILRRIGPARGGR